MLSWIDKAIKLYLKQRWRRIQTIRSNAIGQQEGVLEKIINQNAQTKVGKRFQFKNIKNIDDYRAAIPVVTYDKIQNSIEKMMLGEPDVLVPGKVKWWAKSSGTTSARSKYIPVTEKYFYGNIIKSSWDAVAVIYHYRPDAHLFADKSLIMGGTLGPYQQNPEITVGDISAIMIKRIPAIGRPFYTPDFEIALLSDWEDKIKKMARQCLDENVVLFGGVPTWNILLFQRMLEMSEKRTISEIWPNLHTYLHGGVGFKPYKEQFNQLIGKEDFDYYEVYNASEGYFAIQDQRVKDGMLLLTDNGIYYEFIPSEEWGKDNPETIPLAAVEIGKQYAIVITSYAGLYRYLPGDTVSFSSTTPYRLKVSGRTKHFINVFGEEVMVCNTDQAIALTCQRISAIVSEYTVGPIHLRSEDKGGHLWLVEFKKEPDDLLSWQKTLDENLRKLNSDYDAKRYKDMALQSLIVHQLPPGTFHRWLKSKGKLGGQHKVPRLSNNRMYVEELLELVK